jgi:hypothetical protein
MPQSGELASPESLCFLWHINDFTSNKKTKRQPLSTKHLFGYTTQDPPFSAIHLSSRSLMQPRKGISEGMIHE